MPYLDAVQDRRYRDYLGETAVASTAGAAVGTAVGGPVGGAVGKIVGDIVGNLVGNQPSNQGVFVALGTDGSATVQSTNKTTQQTGGAASQIAAAVNSRVQAAKSQGAVINAPSGVKLNFGVRDPTELVGTPSGTIVLGASGDAQSGVDGILKWLAQYTNNPALLTSSPAVGVPNLATQPAVPPVSQVPGATYYPGTNIPVQYYPAGGMMLPAPYSAGQPSSVPIVNVTSPGTPGASVMAGMPPWLLPVGLAFAAFVLIEQPKRK